MTLQKHLRQAIVVCNSVVGNQLRTINVQVSSATNSKPVVLTLLMSQEILPTLNKMIAILNQLIVFSASNDILKNTTNKESIRLRVDTKKNKRKLKQKKRFLGHVKA